jgi:hypothetical protein
MFKSRGFGLPPHLYPVAHALMDPRILKLLILQAPGSGKSLLLSCAFPAFEIGQRPDSTVLGTSAGETLMQGFLKTVMDWIEWSPEWRMFFPTVMPDKVAGWSTERGIYVTGRNLGNPDSSYFVAGVTSSVITGKHGSVILMDDIHNRENSANAKQCEIVRDIYYDTLIGRADPNGARFIGAGRRWHEDDVYGHWRDGGEFVTMELQAIREGTNELFWDVTLPADLKCCFTDHIALPATKVAT